MKNKIFQELIRNRLSQVIINEEYKSGNFKIPIHLSLGHEAIAVAISNTLKPQDKLLLTHRNMSYNLARSGKLRPIIDEYYLKESGLANGRLGSMNLINLDSNIIYSSSILANNFSVAAGIAMADNIFDNSAVTFVLGGDGSMEEGSFYESLVMMKSLNLGIIIIIENNEWSLGTHINERRVDINLDKLCESLGIVYQKLDNNSVLDYLNTLQETRIKCKQNSQPICIEVNVKTLGDRVTPPTHEFPNGKYINYHAGPASTVDIKSDFYGLILRENSEDPLFVLQEEIGIEKLNKYGLEILEQLKTELL